MLGKWVCLFILLCYAPTSFAINCNELLSADNARVLFFKRSLQRAGSTQELARLRYGKDFGAQALFKLRGLGPQFEVLIADPGIVLRVDHFIEFALSRRHLDPWALRQAYSGHLGTARVFRALAMTPEMAKTAEEKGLLATYLRPEGAELRKNPVDPYTHNIFSMMKERYRNANGDIVATSPDLPTIDGLLSVTYDVKIAKLVAGQIVKSLQMPEVKMYIYEIEIPVLDLLARPGDDGKIESFVLLRIHRDKITSVVGPVEPEMIEL